MWREISFQFPRPRRRISRRRRNSSSPDQSDDTGGEAGPTRKNSWVQRWWSASRPTERQERHCGKSMQTEQRAWTSSERRQRHVRQVRPEPRVAFLVISKSGVKKRGAGVDRRLNEITQKRPQKVGSWSVVEYGYWMRNKEIVLLVWNAFKKICGKVLFFTFFFFWFKWSILLKKYDFNKIGCGVD